MLKKLLCSFALCAAIGTLTAETVCKIDSSSVPPDKSKVTKTADGFVFAHDSTWEIGDQVFDGNGGSIELDLILNPRPLDPGMKRRINAVLAFSGPARPGIVINQYSNTDKLLLNFTIFDSNNKAQVCQVSRKFNPGQEYKLKFDWDKEKITLSVDGKVEAVTAYKSAFKSSDNARLRIGFRKGHRDAMPFTLKRLVISDSK